MVVTFNKAHSSCLLAFLLILSICQLSTSLTPNLSGQRPHPRSAFLHDFSKFMSFGLSNQFATRPSFAMMSSTANNGNNNPPIMNANKVIYESISLHILDEQIPVAAWYPSTINERTSNEYSSRRVTYPHRISVQKIGKSLAGWNFIPSFTTRTFAIDAAENVMRIEKNITTQTQQYKPNFASCTVPVVLLAHGYLGSRFDLSHYAEDLASNGFLVLSPEYPESLADSYDSTTKPIDRTLITHELLSNLQKQWEVNAVTYSIIGHSLGCGTVNKTGDDTWNRVCLAGFPSSGSKSLFVGSTNDGAVPLSRALDALQSLQYTPLEESVARGRQWGKLSPRTSLIFSDANSSSATTTTAPPPPNHISFLSKGTNDAMVDFLSPLLPVARFLDIPVLDFDKYQLVRDSDATGEVVRPLVVDYLRQMSSS